jgi:hypothetical protein
MKSESPLQIAFRSRTPSGMCQLLGIRNLRSLAMPLMLAFMLSQTALAAGVCPASSAIDQVPFFIGQIYFDILNRAPDAASQKPRIAQLEERNAGICKSANPGVSVGSCEWNNNAQMALIFLDSPESISKNGSTTSNSGFLTALYRLLLHRAPDDAGMKLHLSVLGSGETRQAMVLTFLSSDEYRRHFGCTVGGTSNPSCRGGESVDPAPAFVEQAEKDILGKAFDQAERNSLTDYVTSNEMSMCANVSATAFSACDYIIEAQMVMKSFSGAAYQKANPPIVDNRAFVTALYQHLLQRAPDGGGLEAHTNRLKETNDRVGAVYSFLTSEEYRKRFSCYAGARDRLNLGMNGHPLTQAVYSDSGGVKFDDQLAKVQESGAGWYRFDVSAASTGVNFTQMDALVSKAQAHGVRLLPVLMPPVNLAHEDASAIYQKSYAGAVNFVSRYKTSIHVWELANEEDIYSMHVLGDPGWPYPTPSGEQVTDYNPQKYAAVAAMLRGLADGVRAADGSALRIIDFAGWLHTGFLQRLENDRIPYDIVGIHWYQGYGEITCAGQPLPCPARLQHFNVVQRLQTISNHKPMWMTETNYSPSPGDSDEMDLARRQKYLVPVLQTYLNSPSLYPFQTVMVYELLDEPSLRGGVTQTKVGMFTVKPTAEGKFDLGSPKPEYHSVKGLFGR